MLQSWNPWQELEDLQRRLGRTAQEGTTVWAPATDIVEDSEGLYLYLDLPDVDDESLEVETEESSLNVKATRTYKKTEAQTVHYQGRPKGAFGRTFNVPSSFDLSAVTASYESGVLTLFVPRSESTKPRKVEVSTSPAKKETKDIEIESHS